MARVCYSHAVESICLGGGRRSLARAAVCSSCFTRVYSVNLPASETQEVLSQILVYVHIKSLGMIS